MNKIYVGVLLSLGLILSSCSDIDSLKDKFTNHSDVSVAAGTIKYNDGSTMGVTKSEPMVNGGFQIYDVGTGKPNGFILVDGTVINMGGKSIGICQGAHISDNGVEGECIVPLSNPLIPPKEPEKPAEPTLPPQQTPPSEPVQEDPAPEPAPPSEPASPVVTDSTTITTTDGEVIRVDKTTKGLVFAGHEGKIVLLEMYGWTCPHCIAAIPGYNRLQRKYPDDVYVITIESYGTIDNAGLQAYVRQHDIQYSTVAKENAGTIHSYVQQLTGYTVNSAGVPALLVFSREGKLAEYLPPQGLPEARVDSLIQSLL